MYTYYENLSKSAHTKCVEKKRYSLSIEEGYPRNRREIARLSAEDAGRDCFHPWIV